MSKKIKQVLKGWQDVWVEDGNLCVKDERGNIRTYEGLAASTKKAMRQVRKGQTLTHEEVFGKKGGKDGKERKETNDTRR